MSADTIGNIVLWVIMILMGIALIWVAVGKTLLQKTRETEKESKRLDGESNYVLFSTLMIGGIAFVLIGVPFSGSSRVVLVALVLVFGALDALLALKWIVEFYRRSM